MPSHFSSVWLFATLYTIARQASLFMELSRQEFWSGLPCPFLGDLPNPGIKLKSLVSLALVDRFFTTSATQETQIFALCSYSVLSSSLWHHGLYPARLLCPFDSPGKDTKVGCHFLLQGIFQTQGSNWYLLGLLHWQANSFTTEPPLLHSNYQPCKSVNWKITVQHEVCKLSYIQHLTEDYSPGDYGLFIALRNYF